MDPASLPDGIEIQIAPDGAVQIHARCQPGERPEDCEAKVRFLIEALGVPVDGVETTIEPAPGSERTPGGSRLTQAPRSDHDQRTG